MNARDPLAAFDAAVFSEVAADAGRDVAALRDLVARHQESVRDLPGVENWVYEARRAFPSSPLIERRPDAYYLAVEDGVWAEFGDALSIDAGALSALRAVHDRQFRAAVGDPGTGAPLVLTRP